MEGNICSEGAAAVAPDGTLLFGTFGGMLAVSPVNPERDMTRARPPLITNIMVNGLEPWQDTALAGLVAGADTTGRMELGHDQGNITLCFSNMDYANAESSFFMYSSWLSLLPRLAPHRHPAADYLRASLASMHSVAWGTFIRRSFGMSLPVVLQMP